MSPTHRYALFAEPNFRSSADLRILPTRFARDKGLPFHPFLSRVRPSSNVPANAVYITLAFTCLLALIIIGSTAAFNIILSVSATGLFTSYIVCVGCVLAKRLRGEPFPETKFSLGRVGGVVVNVLALCFLTVAWFFLFFPAVPDPGPAGMNWAVLIVSFVLRDQGGDLADYEICRIGSMVLLFCLP